MSGTLQTPVVVAFLGDSLTLGGTGVELHAWPARLDVDPTLFPQCATANFGKSGDQSSGFLTRFEDGVEGKGFALVAILGCKNDVTNDVPVATSWANIKQIVDAVVAEGIPCWLLSDLPFKASGDWTSGRQVLLDGLRAQFEAYAAATDGVTYVDTYAEAGSEADPQVLRSDWAYPDGKHLSAGGNAGMAAFLAPLLAELFPAPPSPTPEDSLNLFGVTAAIVRADYFSQNLDFSTESNPTSASVGRFINQKAAELGGKLRAEEQSPSAIDALTTSEAYLWCQETLCLMVACRIAEDMMQARPPLADTWEKRLLERLESLADDAEGTLGDGSTSPAEQPDGPDHFIDQLDLDVSENERCASSVTAPLRKDDLL